MLSELQIRINELIAQYGGLRAAARALNCDPGYLSRLQTGKKNNPSAELLIALGLKRITVVNYERV